MIMQFDRMWRKEKQSKTLCMTSYWKQNMIKIFIILMIVCTVSSCVREENIHATDQGVNVVDRLINSLEGREVWAGDSVKIFLSNPNVIVTNRHPAGNLTIIHALPDTQNDFHVPMIRVNSGDNLYEISDEEYAELGKPNQKFPQSILRRRPQFLQTTGKILNITIKVERRELKEGW